MINQIIFGDCRDSMRKMIDSGTRVQMCVTSPPYFGLRDYGIDGQIGLEASVGEYVANLVEVFRLVRDLLADDGVLWLNLGDSYASRPNGPNGVPKPGSIAPHVASRTANARRSSQVPDGLKHKDLIGIPWRVAFALQADGWYLRQDIIWHKPNPMPESVSDRCTKSHEYIFLLSKSPRYYYDSQAIKEPVAAATVIRLAQDLEQQAGSDRVPNKLNGNMKACIARPSRENFRRLNAGKRSVVHPNSRVATHRAERADSQYDLMTRNKRSIWTVPTRSYKGAHFATFPPALIEPCIRAGSRANDIVFDPFMGSGTTAEVAIVNDRHYLGCELNPAYKPLQDERIHTARHTTMNLFGGAA